MSNFFEKFPGHSDEGDNNFQINSIDKGGIADNELSAIERKYSTENIEYKEKIERLEKELSDIDKKLIDEVTKLGAMISNLHEKDDNIKEQKRIVAQVEDNIVKIKKEIEDNRKLIITQHIKNN